MKRLENSWNCEMMWRSQLLKFFKLFKLTTKHTKHGPSRTLEISGSFQMHDFAAFSILNPLLSRFVAKPIFATRCGLFDPIPLFFNVFFSKSWWSTAVACTPPISANALHLVSAQKWEIFMASHTMLFFRIFRTSMLALCPTPVSEFRRTDATAQQP